MNSEELITYLTTIQRAHGGPVPVSWENSGDEGDPFYPAEAYYIDSAVRIYRDIPAREVEDASSEEEWDDWGDEPSELDSDDWHDPANWVQNGGEGR